MKKGICILASICLLLDCLGQSYLIRSTSLVNPILVNPAVCGADYLPKATLSYEKEWLSIPQAPSSFYASGEIRLGRFDFYNPRMYINDTRFRSLERVGLGAGIYSDNNGPFNEFNMMLTYSYHLPLNENTAISFGISGKLNHYGVNLSEIDPVTSDDPLISFENHTNVNTSVGTYLYQNEYFLGFSGVDLFNTAASSMNFTLLKQALYGMGGYRFQNVSGSVILEPSVILKYYIREQSVHADFHVKIYLIKHGWLSISYLNETQLSLMLAVRVWKFYYVAYKFSLTQNELNSYTGNTHGILLGINLGVNRNNTTLY